MKEPINDDERLSALFDGRVVGRERDELLTHLAASDDDYEVFADTAEVLRALEEEDAREAVPVHEVPPGVPEPVLAQEATLAEASGVIPFPRPERDGRRRLLQGLAMAAAVAGIVAVSALALRGRAPAAAAPVQLAARLEGEMPAGWVDDRPWEMQRGGDPAAERNARAAQAGAMLMKLAMAVRAGDSVQTRMLAAQIHARFDVGAAPGTPLLRIAGDAAAPADSLPALLDQATHRLEDRLDRTGRDHLRLGAWTEAARLAARGRDGEFFRAPDSERTLQRAEQLTRDDDAAHAAVARVRAALPAEGAPDWESLEAGLKTLLREIAS